MMRLYPTGVNDSHGFLFSIFLQARQREQDFVDDLVLCMRHNVKIRCGNTTSYQC